MKLAIPREKLPGETRVALVPESVKKLVGSGFTVAVESGAGVASGYTDTQYSEAGAELKKKLTELFREAGFILRVGVPEESEIELYPQGARLLTSLMPSRNLTAVKALAARKITSFSTDAIPRTTKAQAMDTLSSMANIAGYKGVLLAAAHLPRYFPMFMTAAGTVLPAKVFVVGAGVAGLQAIATAKRLGAQVFATDVRPEVKEQIESVGAKYVGIELKQSAAAGGGYAKELSEEDKARQKDLLAEQCIVSDVVVTTALIGGVFAPKLISAEMVRKMKPGSIIMDLSADGGGNCELSKPGLLTNNQGITIEHGVTIIAPLNLPATVPYHASLLWSRNLTSFLLAYWKNNTFQLDLEDEILRAAMITHQGEVVHARTKELMK
ncbi:MAG TPA: Re/Si-specific NAD(P)(+) transhydrogenase subunit alpha [Gemmatales bacterium]|nr:Re/Si-specific NAD(P)(+) transhydrogenase subunit alpha [Gemmatales bacterium]